MVNPRSRSRRARGKVWGVKWTIGTPTSPERGAEGGDGMPCVTYLSDSEHTTPTSDQEINAILAEVRQATGDDWRVAETTLTTHRLFRSPKHCKLYVLYSHVQGPEYQVVNFYRPERGEYSINFANDAAHVAAYLYGVLAGIQAAKQKASRP